jgi:hypothetical protein
LTWRQVLAWRMERHHLVTLAPTASWLQAVSRICGLQAQVLSSAELSVWARVDGFARGALDDALWHERTVVKLWVMRGTLHIVPAAEFGLWQAGSGQYQHDRRPSWYRYMGVNEAEMDRMIAAMGKALKRRMLTREELAVEVSRILGDDRLAEPIRQSWGLMMKPASFLGQLCFAPNAGRNVRFTNPATWLPKYCELDSHTAKLEIARRYLAAYGPASAVDLAHWWGVPVRAAANAILDLGDEAVPVDIEGTGAWMRRADLLDTAVATPWHAVRLLPAFDPYVISASPHVRHLLPGDFRRSIYRPQGWLSPVLVIDGRMEGVWRWERAGGRLVVNVSPFVKVPKWARAAAEREAARLAKFMGGALEYRWHDP